MSKLPMWKCETCGTPLAAGQFRIVTYAEARVKLCKLCFLKLSEQDRADSKRQTKLRHQVEYTQTELPF